MNEPGATYIISIVAPPGRVIVFMSPFSGSEWFLARVGTDTLAVDTVEAPVKEPLDLVSSLEERPINHTPQATTATASAAMKHFLIFIIIHSFFALQPQTLPPTAGNFNMIPYCALARMEAGPRAHLRNSPHGFLMIGNNCLKQLSVGVRARGLAAPLYRLPSAATLGGWIRFAVRAPLSKLFFPVVPVVSNLEPSG